MMGSFRALAIRKPSFRIVVVSGLAAFRAKAQEADVQNARLGKGVAVQRGRFSASH